MNELLVVFLVLVTLVAAYFWVYPTYAGSDVVKMAWLDLAVCAVPLAITGILFWEPNPRFSLVFLETNWFLFTLITYAILELPLFVLYVKARGLWPEYRRRVLGFDRDNRWSLVGNASIEQVEKQLDDEKWNGLRTPAAKRFLVIAFNVVILGGTIALFLVEDDPWATYTLIHVLLLAVFWFLLRRSVRLVADAPDGALDERLRADRNRTYVGAYQMLAFLLALLLMALMVIVVIADSSAEPSVFRYEFTVTWPQVQAMFWLLLGYSAALPSMVLAWSDSKKEDLSV
jgi:hypothetical protein